MGTVTPNFFPKDLTSFAKQGKEAQVKGILKNSGYFGKKQLEGEPRKKLNFRQVSFQKSTRE